MVARVGSPAGTITQTTRGAASARDQLQRVEPSRGTSGLRS